jgi:hypothetical protein
MAADSTKTKTDALKPAPLAENKTAEVAAKPETGKETGKETSKADAAKADAAPSRKGMGEGQKPVSQAYKDNWNAIFAKKKRAKKSRR